MKREQFDSLMEFSSPAFVYEGFIGLWWREFLKSSFEYTPEEFEKFVQEEIKSFSLDYSGDNLIEAAGLLYQEVTLKIPVELLETGFSRETAQKIADSLNHPPLVLKQWIQEPVKELLTPIYDALNNIPTKGRMEELVKESSRSISRLEQFIGSSFTIPLQGDTCVALHALLDPKDPKTMFKVMDTLTTKDAMEYMRKAKELGVLTHTPDMLEYLLL